MDQSQPTNLSIEDHLRKYRFVLNRPGVERLIDIPEKTIQRILDGSIHLAGPHRVKYIEFVHEFAACLDVNPSSYFSTDLQVNVLQVLQGIDRRWHSSVDIAKLLPDDIITSYPKLRSLSARVRFALDVYVAKGVVEKSKLGNVNVYRLLIL